MGLKIVCCIAKNEAKYIKEFVDYHLKIGFDQIIIGDNNDTDENYKWLINEYNTDGIKVVVYNLHNQYGIQKEFYNYIIDSYDYEWCAFIDCDEFITFSENSPYKTIGEFLNCDKNIKAYCLNWMVYGDNGRTLAGEGLVTERFKEPKPIFFKYHYPFPENFNIKSIIHKGIKEHFDITPHNVSNTLYCSPSKTSFYRDSPFNPKIDYDIVYIRHFYTKSLEEWVNKKMKNKFADIIPNENKIYYPLDDYFIYNEITEEKLNYLKENGIEYKSKLQS